MREAGGGRFINFASSSIKQPIDDLILSNSFRAGIVGLSTGLSQKLISERILINMIGHGSIATDRLNHIKESEAESLLVSHDEVKEQAERSIPMGRLGEPEEFAKVVLFLGSGANTYITGQSLLVDGGLVKAL